MLGVSAHDIIRRAVRLQLVEFDFFLDLKGKMKSFYKQFGNRRQEIEERLQAIAEQQQYTLSASEDEDADGNLRYDLLHILLTFIAFRHLISLFW